MSVGILKAAKGKQQLEYQISINHHKQYTIYFTCFHSSNFPLIAHHRAATLTRLVLYSFVYRCNAAKGSREHIHSALDDNRVRRH